MCCSQPAPSLRRPWSRLWRSCSTPARRCCSASASGWVRERVCSAAQPAPLPLLLLRAAPHPPATTADSRAVACAGALHVVTGPDHLSAISQLAAGQPGSRWRAAWLGLRWGLGHWCARAQGDAWGLPCFANARRRLTCGANAAPQRRLGHGRCHILRSWTKIRLRARRGRGCAARAAPLAPAPCVAFLTWRATQVIGSSAQ